MSRARFDEVDGTRGMMKEARGEDHVGADYDIAMSRATFDLVAWMQLGLARVRPGGKVLLFAHTKKGDALSLDAGAVCVDEKTVLGSYSSSVDLNAETARTLGVVSTLVTPAIFTGIVPAVALSGYLIWNGTSLPKWIGIIGLVAAIPGLVAIFSVANSGAFQPFGIFSLGSFLLASLYILLVGVFMWLRAPAS